METLNTYNQLSKLSQKIYRESEELQPNLEICNAHSDQIIEALISDLKAKLSIDIKIKSRQFILDDETYRQCASGLIAYFYSDSIDLRVECLIDHNTVWLKIKEGPLEIKQKSESKYDMEGHVELRPI